MWVMTTGRQLSALVWLALLASGVLFGCAAGVREGRGYRIIDREGASGYCSRCGQWNASRSTCSACGARFLEFTGIGHGPSRIVEITTLDQEWLAELVRSADDSIVSGNALRHLVDLDLLRGLEGEVPEMVPSGNGGLSPLRRSVGERISELERPRRRACFDAEESPRGVRITAVRPHKGCELRPGMIILGIRGVSAGPVRNLRELEALLVQYLLYVAGPGIGERVRVIDEDGTEAWPNCPTGR